MNKICNFNLLKYQKLLRRAKNKDQRYRLVKFQEEEEEE